MAPSVRMLLIVTLVLVGIGGILYWITAVRTTAASAFDIASGTASPFALKAGPYGVALAVVGYLFAPAVAGAIVAAVVDSAQRDRATSLANLKPKLVEEISAKFIEHQAAAATAAAKKAQEAAGATPPTVAVPK